MMSTANRYIVLLCTLALGLATCTKDVTLDFPEIDSMTVVDGSISLGQPAIVFLTRTQSLNEGANLQSSDLFEQEAEVYLSNAMDTIQLTEICADNLTEEQLILVAQQLGIDPAQIAALNYCAYVDFAQTMVGEENTDYHLDITTADGRKLLADTRIGTPVPLDSLWFELWASSDSLGFLHALMTDPVGDRNAYRWRAQRINAYPDGTQKDFAMISPLGSHFEDRFFDGLSFEIFYNRGNLPFSSAEDDNNEEDGFYKIGDTVVVEFSTTTLASYNYWTISDDQLVNNGSPFAVPANVPSNVEGGLGLWAGYAQALDTVVCIP